MRFLVSFILMWKKLLNSFFHISYVLSTALSTFHKFLGESLKSRDKSNC